jgi:hypothetical protein
MVLPSLSTVMATLVFYGLLFAIVRRPWTTLGITLYVLCFALLASYVKQAYLGVAMTLADVHFFLLRPVENFHLFINYPLLGMSLLGMCLGFVLCLVVGVRFERPVHLLSRPRLGGWLRLGTATAFLVLGMGAALVASEQSRAQVDDGDAYAAFLAMYEMQHVGGVVNRLNVFFNNRSVEATLPAEHEQTRFGVLNTPTADVAAGIRPDIFLILEESTFDATLLRDCVVAECDNAMLHPLAIATRTQQGPLLVHTTGGGTWLAEFAIMSGFDWRIFGRGGAYAPVSLAPRMHASLPERLRALGYRTVAIYPTDGNFLSAQSAYGYYGFDEFYAARDMELPDDWQETYDHVVFDKALKLALRKDDTRPVFVFALTIRNHGPHGEGKVTVPPTFLATEKKNGAALADYLARMRDSSTDFTRLADQWLQSTRPRVIAWFGDHQPEAAWEFTEHPDRLHRDLVADNVSGKQLQYLTHYQLSANFGERQQNVSRHALDIAFLGTELLSFAGLPLDAGEIASREMATACNGLLLDCANRALVNDYLSYRIYQLGAVL